MGSKKPSARAKQIAAFKSQLDDLGMDDVFAREERREAERAAEHEEALREKACRSKNRYASRREAEDAIASCAAHGTTGLHCYRCRYCHGWHLTSKPAHDAPPPSSAL